MNLDWTTIASIATVIGVAGGLVSLVKLIVEVRRNAQAIEGSIVQSLMSFEKDVFTLIANNAELYLKGSTNLAKLKPAEKLAYREIVSVQMSLFYNAYVQHQQELIDDEVWDAYVNAYINYLKAPGFRACWKGFETHYPKSFRDMVNPTIVDHTAKQAL